MQEQGLNVGSCCVLLWSFACSARQPAHRRSHVATLTASWLASTSVCHAFRNGFHQHSGGKLPFDAAHPAVQHTVAQRADAWPAIQCEGPEKRWCGGLLLIFDGHDSFDLFLDFSWTPESEHPLLHIPLLGVHGQGVIEASKKQGGFASQCMECARFCSH